MANRLFTQEELNRIVASRLQRERDRLDRKFEDTLKRCMAAVHLTLYQEMCAMKRDMAAEMKDTLLSGVSEPNAEEQPPMSPSDSTAARNTPGGGEGQ